MPRGLRVQSPGRGGTLNRIFARRLRTTLVYAAIGLLLGPLAGLLTGMLDGLPLFWPAVRGGVVGVIVGVAVGAGEEFLLPYASRRLGFLGLNLLRLGAYLLVMQGSLVVVNTIRLVMAGRATWVTALGTYLGEGGFPRDLSVTLAATLVMIPLLQVKRLHHASEILRLVTGRYHYPKEEELVFLWVDLAGSTRIAERLGHLGCSRLLRDVFADLSEPILAWRGRVYQHVGDGVIVTWTSRALQGAAPVWCFFDMAAHLVAHGEHYQARYGFVPTIRGAVHVGPVVTTWVGEAKKELAYHGDTLNAASRMQGACKRLGVSLLVSERVARGAEHVEGLSVRSVGEVELEGKEAAPELYAVDRAVGVA